MVREKIGVCLDVKHYSNYDCENFSVCSAVKFKDTAISLENSTVPFYPFKTPIYTDLISSTLISVNVCQ